MTNPEKPRLDYSKFVPKITKGKWNARARIELDECMACIEISKGNDATIADRRAINAVPQYVAITSATRILLNVKYGDELSNLEALNNLADAILELDELHGGKY